MEHETHELFDEIAHVEIERPTPKPWLTVLLHFATPEDRRAFEVEIGRGIPPDDVIWYPRDPSAQWR